MSEITINKNNKSISFTHNNIAFSQFGIADEILDLITDLQNQLQQKENIIKEVRNWVNSTIDIIKQQPTGNDEWILERLNVFLEILDKGE